MLLTPRSALLALLRLAALKDYEGARVPFACVRWVKALKKVPGLEKMTVKNIHASLACVDNELEVMDFPVEGMVNLAEINNSWPPLTEGEVSTCAEDRLEAAVGCALAVAHHRGLVGSFAPSFF